MLLYSEVDPDGRELRKVDVFRDGHVQYASDEGASGDTDLSEILIPSLRELAEDPQFEPVEITDDEFAAVWAQREAGRVEGAALAALEQVNRSIDDMFSALRHA